MKRKIIILTVAATLLSGSFSLEAQKKTNKKETPATETPKANTPTSEEADALTEKAQAGDAEAQYELGEWIFNGKYYKENKEVAVKWWEKSAKQKNGKATAALANCVKTGTGVEKADSVKAIQLYLQAFRFGNKVALDNMEKEAAKNAFAGVVAGQAYRDGAGVKKNIDKAIYYYHTAATLGSKDVVYALADMTYGIKDYAAAMKWYKKAASMDNLSEKERLAASFRYGKLLIEGANGKPEPSAGFPYVARAAEKGLPGAEIQLARCFWEGIGTDVDLQKGFDWMLTAAKQGYPEAQWEVAIAIIEGKGTVKDFPAAQMWMTQAANRSSINRFKKWIENEETIKTYPDYILWLQGCKALSANNFDAAAKVVRALKKAKYADYASYFEAMALVNTENKKANQKKGLQGLEKLAQTSSFIKCQLVRLAIAGTIKDYTPNMVQMLESCITDNWYPAYELLGNIYFDGRGVEKNIQKALVNYLKAKDCGVLSAAGYNRLVTCYENGWGVEKNIKKADELKKSTPRDLKKQMLDLVPAIEG